MNTRIKNKNLGAVMVYWLAALLVLAGFMVPDANSFAGKNVPAVNDMQQEIITENIIWPTTERSGLLPDAGRSRFNIHCPVIDSPHVAVTKALGDIALEWNPVPPAGIECTRSCKYGRTIYGWIVVSCLIRVYK